LAVPADSAEPVTLPTDLFRALDALPRDAIPAAIALLAARLLTEAPPVVPRRAQELGRLLTAGEAAARLGVDRRWVYRHARELGGIALSRRKLRVPEVAVERFLARRARVPLQPGGAPGVT
jgi:excisionase family DNA binding protein